MVGITSLLRLVIGGIVGFFIALGSLVSGHVLAINPPLPAPAATTTQQVIATTTQSQSPKQASATSTKARTEPVASSTTTTTSTPILPAHPSLPIETLNALARASLVNILCTTAAGGSFNPISGSGVVIDSRGIILTNAHVGQYFLLRNYGVANNVQCVVRTGSPATSRYTAELLYLPPQWITDNASKITAQEPTGTGENDYAFLLITGSTNPSVALPSSFPALPMDAADPNTGEQMVLAAYPAGFLGGISIALNLYTTSAVASVGQLYNFVNPANVDLFSLGGTVVSQSGSSGGAVVNGLGKLNGLIVTEIPADTTSQRDLRALTISHIDRSLAAQGQGGITALLSQDIVAFAAKFNAKIAPAETQALEEALDK